MNLLRTEFRKILPYRTFWIILGIYVLLMVLILYTSTNVQINGQSMGNETFQFPELWMRLSYVAHFFNLLLGILVIVLVTDEYSYRTLRQQVIDGLSRTEVVLSKFYVVLGLATFSTLFLLVLGLYLGLVYSKDTSATAILSQIDYLPYYFVQAVAYMALAVLFAFLIRKSGLTIIAFIAYTKIVEPIIHYNLPDHIDKYFPMKVLDSLTPMPGRDLWGQVAGPFEQLSPAMASLPSIVYIGLFLLLSYLVLKLRDL